MGVDRPSRQSELPLIWDCPSLRRAHERHEEGLAHDWLGRLVARARPLPFLEAPGVFQDFVLAAKAHGSIVDQRRISTLTFVAPGLIGYSVCSATAVTNWR